jgi:hypothetical protein
MGNRDHTQTFHAGKVSHIQAAVDGQTVWIAGGFIGKNPGAPSTNVWRYDTVNDLWYSGPALSAQRAAGLLVREGRKLHYIGGVSSDRDTSYASHWALNLDNLSEGWKSSTGLPNPSNHHSGAYIDSGNRTVVAKADLPFPRSHFEPGTVIVGGRANQNGTDTVSL